MSLREQLLEDLKAAMRAGDKVRVSTLRYLRSAMGYAEVEKQRPLDDSEVLDIISHQVKQRNDSIREFELGKRADLVAQERAEMEILVGYLPQQASRDEIVAAARDLHIADRFLARQFTEAVFYVEKQIFVLAVVNHIARALGFERAQTVQ